MWMDRQTTIKNIMSTECKKHMLNAKVLLECKNKKLFTRITSRFIFKYMEKQNNWS